MNGPRSLPQHLPACDTSLQLLHRLVTAGQLRLTSQIRARSRGRTRITRLPFLSCCDSCPDDLDAIGSKLGLRGPGAPDALVRGSRRGSASLRFGGTDGASVAPWAVRARTCSSLMLQTISLPPCAHLISHTGNPQPGPLSPNRHRSSTLVRFPRSGGEPLAYFLVTQVRRGNEAVDGANARQIGFRKIRANTRRKPITPEKTW